MLLPPTYRPDNSRATQDCGESLKEPSSAGQSCSQRTTSDEVSESGVLHVPSVWSERHTFMSSKTQYTNTRRNARVSALFCVSRQKLD